MRRIMLVFTMIALVTTMVAVSALSGTAQEERDNQYDEESDELYRDWYNEYREGLTKEDPPSEEDSPPEPEPDPEPVCTDWLQDWYIWENPRGEEDWWYFYWYKWCYDPAEEKWFIIWDGWEWWGPV